jgi:hypothetical protein
MFSVITKEEYWNWWDAGVVTGGKGTLKDIQDAFAHFHLKDIKGSRICEVGGGDSRILSKLSSTNECWNVDKFDGQSGGPAKLVPQPGVRVAKTYLGEFSPELPDEYFDVVFSISVVEHIPFESYEKVIQDCVRVLKPGGVMMHAIDVYIPDASDESGTRDFLRKRIDLYLKTVAFGRGHLSWLSPPTIDRNVAASARFACNQVDELRNWNKVVPNMRHVRETADSCSLQMILERT